MRRLILGIVVSGFLFGSVSAYAVPTRRVAIRTMVKAKVYDLRPGEEWVNVRRSSLRGAHVFRIYHSRSIDGLSSWVQPTKDGNGQNNSLSPGRYMAFLPENDYFGVKFKVRLAPKKP